MRLLDELFSWVTTSEVVLLSVVLGLALESFVRVERVRRGWRVPRRLAMHLAAAESRQRSGAGKRVVRGVARVALGWGSFLPTLARIAAPWGGLLFLMSLVVSSCHQFGSAASHAQMLMRALSEGLRHVALGLGTALLANVLHVVLVARARRAIRVRVREDPGEDSSRVSARDELGLSRAYWARLTMACVSMMLVAYADVTSSFTVHEGVRISYGVCGRDALSLRVGESGSLTPLLVTRGRAEWRLRDPESDEVRLRFDDSVTLQEAMYAFDRVNGVRPRTLCFGLEDATPKTPP